uniref:Transmembrane protein n=1 Tax=Helianthus annuus TaxID=4232 RepID=A0A251T100_HELAN
MGEIPVPDSLAVRDLGFLGFRRGPIGSWLWFTTVVVVGTWWKPVTDRVERHIWRGEK